jgi:hypothetical protein
MTRHGVKAGATPARGYGRDRALDCEPSVEESKTAPKPPEAELA